MHNTARSLPFGPTVTIQAEDSVSHNTKTLERIFNTRMATPKWSKMITNTRNTMTVPELEASLQDVQVMADDMRKALFKNNVLETAEEKVAKGGQEAFHKRAQERTWRGKGEVG